MPNSSMPRDIVKNLLRKKLAWGSAVIVVAQIQGALPSLDILSQNWLKVLCFLMGCLLSVSKGIEMYFDQSAALEKGEDEKA